MKTPPSADLIQKGDLKQLLALCWRFIMIYAIAGEMTIEEQQKFSGTPEEMLLQWVNSLMPPGYRVKNFSDGFKSGKGFSYIINAALLVDSQKLTTEQINKLSNKELLEKAFDIAESQLAIPRLLDAEVIQKSPDKSSIMTYVSLLRSSVHAADKMKFQVEN
eukprot:UN26530